MSFENAMERAYWFSLERCRKMYVRAYRKLDGSWRYGVYTEPRPDVRGRTWE